jgi:hypothetical protein
MKCGGYYLDEDGDMVCDVASAMLFGSELHVSVFLAENPVMASKGPQIVSRDFSDSELMSFVKSYDMHMKLKRCNNEEP